MLIFYHVDHPRLPESRDNLVALGIPLLAYGMTELAHGYGFLAVFVAALTLRHWERSHHYRGRLHEFAEQIERASQPTKWEAYGKQRRPPPLRG